MEIEIVINKWFYKFYSLKSVYKTENIYDFEVSPFVKCSRKFS